MNKHKGFTLIELLVVIAILAALSAAMAISSSGAVASAKAATIISNLQSIKTGALVFYNDYREQSRDTEFTETSFNAVSNDYLDEATIKMINKDGRYALKMTTGSPKQWYVGYAMDATETDNEQVLKKLAARADNVGLTGGGKASKSNGKYKFDTVPGNNNSAAITTGKTPSTAIWMRVR